MKTKTSTASALRSALVAAVIYFAVVFCAGFILGIVRVLFLVPRLGERVAELIETPFMLAVVYFAARSVVRRDSTRVIVGGWALVGVGALVLLLAAEVGLVLGIQGRDVSEYISSRDPVSGSVYLVSLVLYAAMPWLQSRWQARSSDESGVSPP